MNYTYQAITEGQLWMNNLRRIRMLLIKNGQDLDVVRRWIGNSGVAEEIIGFYVQKAATDFGGCPIPTVEI